MSSTWKIRDREQIPEVLGKVEEETGKRLPSGMTPSTGILICEELVTQLYQRGFTQMDVKVRGRKTVRTEICVNGDAESWETNGPQEAAEEDIGAQISRYILDQYAGRIDCRYSGGRSHFRILFNASAWDDLSPEITEISEEISGSGKGKPREILLRLFARHPRMVILTVLNLLLKHGCALLLPVFAGQVIDLIQTGQPFFRGEVWISLILALLALVINLICAWLNNRYFHRFTRAVESGFKMALVRKIQLLSMRFHHRTSTGRILSKLVSDVQFIQSMLYDYSQNVLCLLEDIVCVIVISLIRMPVMLAFFAVALPLDALLLRRFLRPIWESKHEMRMRTESSNVAFQELLQNDPLMRSQGLQKTEYQKISTNVHRVRTSSVRYDRQQLNLASVIFGSAQGLRLACLCVAGILASAGGAGMGDVFIFLSLFDMIVKSIQKVLDQMPQMVQGYDSLVSVSEVLLEKDTDRNGENLLDRPVQGEIDLRHVSFSYDEKEVLRDVSIHVPAGKTAALVGASGSGKTTVLNLILGMYSPQQGQVLVDGQDLKELDKTDYRHHIAVVPQTTNLFEGTLMDNLLYGLRYVSTRRVMEVLGQVGLEGIVRDHPRGLYQPVSEDGSNFSAGQRQRIAIARALLREPKLILFDEATSALDDRSEKQVQTAIEAIMGKCTVIMVAHRLSTLRRADLFYRMEGQRVRGCASFEEMMDAQQQEMSDLSGESDHTEKG